MFNMHRDYYYIWSNIPTRDRVGISSLPLILLDDIIMREIYTWPCFTKKEALYGVIFMFEQAYNQYQEQRNWNEHVTTT
jgi:hypothetical protein